MHTIQTPAAAWRAILEGLIYFLVHNTKVTLLILLLIAGAVLYVAMDYSKDMQRLKSRTGQVKQP